MHLGCGCDIRPGWVNIDVMRNPAASVAVDSSALYVEHDLRSGLPLDADCCSFVYSSHFLEHLEYVEAVRLLSDCHRVLTPGGIIRLALPDYPRFFRAYLEGDLAFFDLIDVFGAVPGLERGHERIVDYVSYMVFERGGHKHLYDREKVVSMLERLGFKEAVERDFDPDVDPTVELRQRYSFYMEGIK